MIDPKQTYSSSRHMEKFIRNPVKAGRERSESRKNFTAMQRWLDETPQEGPWNDVSYYAKAGQKPNSD